MHGFKFKLQRVLDYKTIIEGLNKSNYSNELENLKTQEKTLENLIENKKNIIGERNRLAKKVSIVELKNYNAFLNNIEHSIKEKKEDVTTARIKTQDARDVLIKSSKEKEVFLKLKERDMDKHKQYFNKEEEKLTDQLVSFNFSTR